MIKAARVAPVRPRLRVLITLAIAFTVGLAGQSRADTVTDLGALDPMGINVNDQVVGDVMDSDGNLHAGLWNGSLQMLGQLASTDQSDAYAISAGGRIAGDDYTPSIAHGAYWNGGGTPNQVGPFQGVSGSNDDTELNGVDTAGDLVGFTPSPGLVATGFLDHAGTEVEVGQTDLGAQPGGTTVGAITPDGSRMLGYVSAATTTYYLWSSTAPSGPGTALDITPPTSDMRGLDGVVFGTLIQNDLASDGTVLGYKGSGNAKSYYLRLPTGTELPVNGLFHDNAVNRQHVVAGDILGTSISDPIHAAIWTNGVVTDLNTLLPPGSGWDLEDALAINDNGDIVGIGAHNGQADGFLLSTSASVSVAIGSIPKIQVGKTVQVPVTVTAGAANLTPVSLGQGLTVSGNHAKVTAEPEGLTGFSLSPGQSQTFMFPLKGVSEGDAGLSINVGAASTRGNVTDSVEATVHVWKPKLQVIRAKTPDERNPGQSIDIDYRGMGWDPAGGEIGLKLSNENAGSKPQAATFDGTLKIRRWPERTTDEHAIKDHAGGGYCFGKLSATQGALEDGGKIEGKWQGWVLWSANPEIKAREAWCEGEEETFFAKSPVPIVLMGDFPEGRKFGLGVKVWGANGPGTSSPTKIITDAGPVLNYNDRRRDVCVAVSLDHHHDLITTVTHGKCT
jgi:hypothetical protein